MSELLGQTPVAGAKCCLRLLKKGVARARVALGFGANLGVESSCEWKASHKKCVSERNDENGETKDKEENDEPMT